MKSLAINSPQMSLPDTWRCQKDQQLGHLSYSEEYKDKNEEPSNKFTANVIARYMELPNGPAEHQICAFDNVYLDLNAKFDKKKTPTSEVTV
jgi:hypothetical protein